MDRFQVALKGQLTRQNERLEIELKEKARIFCVCVYLCVLVESNRDEHVCCVCYDFQVATLKSLQMERENIGVELYSVQQELARKQMLVEAEQDKHASICQTRKQKDAVLDDIRALHREMSQQIKSERQQSEWCPNLIADI